MASFPGRQFKYLHPTIDQILDPPDRGKNHRNFAKKVDKPTQSFVLAISLSRIGIGLFQSISGHWGS